MILPFSTKINGKQSFFVEKILMGLFVKKLTPEPDFNSICPRAVIIPKGDVIYNIHFDHTINHKPKIHTIREDKNERWKLGTKIDFFINVRQPNMYRFAPVLPVVSFQKIEIIHTEFMNDIIVNIDNKRLNMSELQRLVWNDGFDNIYEFVSYFNEDFVGKIIHWTDFRY